MKEAKLGQPPPDTQAIPKAVARIFRSDDGKLLFAYLRRELMHIVEPGSETSALHELNGRRRFALEILNMTDADLREDGGRKSSRRYPRTDD